MDTPLEGSFALLDATNRPIGFTVSTAGTLLGCVLLLPNHGIAAQTPPPGSICAVFDVFRVKARADRPTGVRLPTILRSLVLFRAFPRYRFRARMVIRIAFAIALLSPLARAAD